MNDRASLFRQEAVDHHFPAHEAAEVIRQRPCGGPLLTTLALAVIATSVFLVTVTMELGLALDGTAVLQAVDTPAAGGCVVSFSSVVPPQRRALVRVGDVAQLELTSSRGGAERIGGNARVTRIHEAPEADAVTFDLRITESCDRLSWRSATPLAVQFKSERSIVDHLFAGRGH